VGPERGAAPAGDRGRRSGAPGGRRRRPVFCIVDPSLRDFVGHHFAYDLSVARAAGAAGFEAVALGHHAVIPEVARALRVVPCFRRDIWGRHPLARGLASRGGGAVGTAGRALDHLLCARDFARDLRRGLAEGGGLPPGSVLLGHMITAKHLPAFAAVLGRLFEGGVDLTAVLLLRYQPALYDNPFAAHGFRRLEALAAARGHHRIRLASDSGRLAEAIGRLTRLPIEVLPIPHTPPGDAAPPRPRRGSATRFVSLGNAREEKGYLEILQAIRLLAAEREGLAGLEFVLQSNDPDGPALRAAIEALAADPPPGVTLLRRPLDEAEYEAQLLAADVVLTPYWRSTYEARTSGVLLEALAAGRPVIATGDTWMADELALHGAGLLVPDRDPAALAAAIRRMARERAAMLRRAGEERAAVRARHSAEALVRQCAGPPPPPRPAAAPRRAAWPWSIPGATSWCATPGPASAATWCWTRWRRAPPRSPCCRTPGRRPCGRAICTSNRRPTRAGTPWRAALSCCWPCRWWAGGPASPRRAWPGSTWSA
jgi:glycosyltransferase involved in cell wall biosynthesis